jgi:hypothetical protein
VAATVATAAAAPRRGVSVVIVVLSAAFATEGGEKRQQAAHFLAVALCADNIVRVLEADQHLKLGFAVRAIILVQWHKRYLQKCRKRCIIMHIVVAGKWIVK